MQTLRDGYPYGSRNCHLISREQPTIVGTGGECAEVSVMCEQSKMGNGKTAPRQQAVSTMIRDIKLLLIAIVYAGAWEMHGDIARFRNVLVMGLYIEACRFGVPAPTMLNINSAVHA